MQIPKDTPVVSRAITGSMVARSGRRIRVTHVSGEKSEVCLQRHDYDLKLDCIPDDMYNEFVASHDVVPPLDA